MLNQMDYWSCGSLPDRGISRAHEGIMKWLTRDVENTYYCLQCDIKKCYQCVSHNVLKKILEKNFKDEKYLDLCCKVIDSFETTEGEIRPFLLDEVCGLPLGNYTSSWWNNLYLTELDRFVRSFSGAKYYIRYVDDFCVFSNSKLGLNEIRSKTAIFIKENLKLQIKNNARIFIIDDHNPVDVVGFKHYHTHSTIRKRNAIRAIKTAKIMMKKVEQYLPLSFHLCAAYLSRIGIFKHCDSFHFTEKYCSLDVINQAKEVIRRDSRKRYAARINNNHIATT